MAGTFRAALLFVVVCLLTATRPSALAASHPTPAVAQRSGEQSLEPVAYGSSCSALTGVGVSGATVTFTLRFPTGTFNPRLPAQQSIGGTAPFRDLPEFCRATLAAVSASNAFRGLEVWLPTHSWNGKLMVVGRDRSGASFDLGRMAAALAGGFVAASLDNRTGPASARPSAGQEAATVAGIHEATRTVQLLVEAFYGPSPRWVYWSGCAAGARDGLLTAERYPEDFDGILAGALSESPAATSGARPPLAIGLAAFRARGGRVLLYDRAADAATAVLPLREHREVRLFLTPGEAGCPDVDDGRARALTRGLEAWVEQRNPPEQIVVPAPGAPQTTRTRLLCPFPKTAVYAGSGSRDDASSFGCVGGDH